MTTYIFRMLDLAQLGQLVGSQQIARMQSVDSLQTISGEPAGSQSIASNYVRSQIVVSNLVCSGYLVFVYIYIYICMYRCSQYIVSCQPIYSQQVLLVTSRQIASIYIYIYIYSSQIACSQLRRQQVSLGHLEQMARSIWLVQIAGVDSQSRQLGVEGQLRQLEQIVRVAS